MAEISVMCAKVSCEGGNHCVILYVDGKRVMLNDGDFKTVEYPTSTVS